jgi:hypothetical protein
MMTVLVWFVVQTGVSFSGSATFLNKEACEMNRLLMIDAMLKKGIKANNVYINCTPAQQDVQGN